MTSKKQHTVEPWTRADDGAYCHNGKAVHPERVLAALNEFAAACAGMDDPAAEIAELRETALLMRDVSTALGGKGKAIDPIAEIAKLKGRLAAAQRYFREHAQDERAEAYPDESSDIAIVTGLGGENSELREIEKLKAENAALDRELRAAMVAMAEQTGANHNTRSPMRLAWDRAREFIFADAEKRSKLAQYYEHHDKRGVEAGDDEASNRAALGKVGGG